MQDLAWEIKTKLQREFFRQDGEISCAPFASSASNNIFQVNANGAIYLAKHLATNPLYTGSRQSQFDLQTELYGAGIAAEPIYLSKDNSIWLERWLPHSQISGAVTDTALQLAEAMYIVHQLEPGSAKQVDLVGNLQRYIEIINAAAASNGNRAAMLEEVEAALVQCEDICFCHNDLSAAHVLSAKPYMVVDWEYAGLGCRYFDLASTIKVNAFIGETKLTFMKAYSTRSGIAMAELQQQVNRYMPIVDFTYELWHNAYSTITTISGA